MSSNWLKANPFVIAALALPLVVVVFFLMATTVPRFLVADPQHDLLFALDDRNAKPSEFSLRFRIARHQLFAEARINPGYSLSSTQSLYLFDANRQEVRRIEAEVPPELQQRLRQELASQPQTRGAGGPQTPWVPPAPAPAPAPAGPVAWFLLPATETMTLLDGTVAPDGYTFENRFTGNRGLLGELFGMGSSRPRQRIEKGSRVIALPVPHERRRNYFHSNATFLGWVAR